MADSLGASEGMLALKSFWATVSASDQAELTAALERLRPYAESPGLRRGLVQVRWGPLLGLPGSAALVRRFLDARADVLSGWVPICHPGSPQHAELGRFATPPDCRRCVFYEGRACQGLGDEVAPFGGLTATQAPALAPVPLTFKGLDALDARAFSGPTPVCYWRPRRRDVSAIGAAVRAAGGSLWDLGAGNGFLSALLARDEGLVVTAIDQLGVYPAFPGVLRVVGDVRAHDGPRPAAVLISWPPTGDGFRDVILSLRPAVLVRAYDAEGFCGRRRAHARILATASDLRVSRELEDDLAPIAGLPLRLRRAVSSHQDLSRGRRAATGILEIRAASTLDPILDDRNSYPWEP